MAVMRLAVLLVAFGAGFGLALVLADRLAAAWNRRISQYVQWFVDRHATMYQTVDMVWARRVISAAVVGSTVVGFLLGGVPAAILFGALGTAGPYAWVRWRESQRRQRLDNQLVDALILMANGLKSGLSLLQAIELAAEETRLPIREELGRLLKEIRLGVGIDDALVSMANRLMLPDLEISVHSIVTLRRTGGNLSESFMTVAKTVTERKKIEGRISTLTAQGRYQGIMLCAMPFIMAVVFYVLDPNYMRLMFTTVLGWAIWAMVVLLDLVGMWMIMKMVKVDV